MKVIVQPRVQTDTWSLYWKSAMRIKTQCLDKVAMEGLAEDTPVAELCAAVAAKLGWPSADSLQALEGFDGQWDRMLLNGREVSIGATLGAVGVADGAVVTLVRVQLEAEGAGWLWKRRGHDWGVYGRYRACAWR